METTKLPPQTQDAEDASGDVAQLASRAGKRVVALEMLAAGNSQQEVADHLGVSKSTVWRWLQDDEFGEQLHKMTRASVSLARRQIEALIPRAIRYLARAVGSKSVPAAIRLQAARDILDRAGLMPPAAEKPGDVDDRSVTAAEFAAFLDAEFERRDAARDAARKTTAESRCGTEAASSE